MESKDSVHNVGTGRGRGFSLESRGAVRSASGVTTKDSLSVS